MQKISEEIKTNELDHLRRRFAVNIERLEGGLGQISLSYGNSGSFEDSELAATRLVGIFMPSVVYLEWWHDRKMIVAKGRLSFIKKMRPLVFQVLRRIK